jgi:hypothetical protein
MGDVLGANMEERYRKRGTDHFRLTDVERSHSPSCRDFDVSDPAEVPLLRLVVASAPTSRQNRAAGTVRYQSSAVSHQSPVQQS